MKLARLKDFSGQAASIYTVLNNDNSNPFSEFLKEWNSDYESKLVNFVSRVKSIGNETGALESLFRLREGLEDDDLVCALHDLPEMEMRLYCIRLSEQILIVGGGGPKYVRAWQEDLKLKRAAEFMISVSGWVRRNIERDLLAYSNDGLRLIGKLELP